MVNAILGCMEITIMILSIMNKSGWWNINLVGKKLSNFYKFLVSLMALLESIIHRKKVKNIFMEN